MPSGAGRNSRCVRAISCECFEVRDIIRTLANCCSRAIGRPNPHIVDIVAYSSPELSYGFVAIPGGQGKSYDAFEWCTEADTIAFYQNTYLLKRFSKNCTVLTSSCELLTWYVPCRLIPSYRFAYLVMSRRSSCRYARLSCHSETAADFDSSNSRHSTTSPAI